MSAAEAADQVGTRDTLAIPLGPGQPGAFMHALDSRDDFDDLRVLSALLIDFYPLFTRSGVKLLSGFYGPVERALAAAGHDVEFVPSDFRRFTSNMQKLAPRIMATSVAPPDEAGYMSLSLHAGASVSEQLRCGRDPERVLIAEANSRLPRTLGLPPEHPHRLHVDDVDILIESDHDVFIMPETEPSAVEHAIAETVQRYIEDGATLQTGIGGIPNAVMSLLANAPGGDYGVHSEMFTTGLMHLHEAGKVSNRKGYMDGFSICTFSAGTEDLYKWLDGNEIVRFLPVDQVNEPGLIARNRSLISINGALAVGLSGEIAADTLNGGQFSGIGGHEDFVAGATFSNNGRSLICLPATANVDGRIVSRITPTLPPGTHVTTPRHQADVVITEYGAAELAGKTIRERAEALALIAHPKLRDALLDDGPDVPSIPA